MGPQHSVSVAATIVDDQGRVLVTQRRDNGHWEPPGGALEVDESVLDGLAREVREETGLHIEATRLTGVYKNMTLGVIALMFRAEVVGGALVPSDEALRAEWWDPDTVAGRMDPAYAVRVLDALRTDGPAVRAHDGVSVLTDAPALPG
jgi:8-oxo-dGTP pyrophosphatase MutT (NUDIX family)